MASVTPSPPVGTTAAEALAQIRTTLSALAPNPTPNAAAQATLHPLARLSLPALRRVLTNSLDSLRRVAAARESWDPAEPSRLLRVKSDAVAKRRAVRSSRAALAACRRLALTSDPFATPVALAIQRLRAVADETGATTAEEAVESVVGGADGVVKRKDRLLTVCGATFLADFQFFDVTAEKIVVKVKFRHLMADESEVGDDDVDASFAQLIRDQDYEALRIAFERLIAQEKLGALVAGEVSLVDALRSFEDDLIAAEHAEKKEEMEDAERMRIGHGLVRRSALGLSISFMGNHTALLGVEDAIPDKLISVSRSYPTVSDDQDSSRHVPALEFSESSMVSVGAQYVLWFRKPITACLSVARNLYRVAGEDPDGDGSTEAVAQQKLAASRDDFMGRLDGKGDDADGRSHSLPTLQHLLAPTVFGNDGDVGDGSAGESKGENVRAAAKDVVKKRVHWSQQATEYVCAAALPGNEYIEFSHSGSDVVPGLEVHRVPLCHPRNVEPIFALVRQQIVFNELFQSCFGAPVYIESTMKMLQPQPVEVVLSDAPSFMQLNSFNETLGDILSIAVEVELGGEVIVTLTTPEDQPFGCSSAKASAILHASRSIPLTIRAIAQLGAKGGEGS